MILEEGSQMALQQLLAGFQSNQQLAFSKILISTPEFAHKRVEPFFFPSPPIIPKMELLNSKIQFLKKE